MSPVILFSFLAGYFLVLYLISEYVSRQGATDNEAFFVADRRAPWFLVAFGMIGTSLSGVTFISVPGDVGVEVVKDSGVLKGLSYLQIVLGYLAGYFVIAFVLLPLYYRRNFISIYTYLKERFGRNSYRTGAFFFLLSRSLGSAARLYLAIIVLQKVIFDAWGVPFWLTAVFMLGFILLYTRKSGLKTIVYTDTVLTAIMLLTVGLTFYYISDSMNLASPIQAIADSPYGTLFVWDTAAPNFFLKDFISGLLIAIVMTGLDQDMMQKNLSCRSLGAAQKNMITYSIILVAVNVLFVGLGALLYLYAAAQGITPPKNSDMFYPLLATNNLGMAVGIMMVVGLISVAYSSSDGALTALTTSYCVDIADVGDMPADKAVRVRKRVHILMTIFFLLLIIGFDVFHRYSDSGGNVITLVLKMAGYTYGPLLGFYTFGLATRRQVFDRFTPYIALASPIICLILNKYAPVWWGYTFGFELIAVNGGITFLLLALISKPGGKKV